MITILILKILLPLIFILFNGFIQLPDGATNVKKIILPLILKKERKINSKIALESKPLSITIFHFVINITFCNVSCQSFAIKPTYVTLLATHFKEVDMGLGIF